MVSVGYLAFSEIFRYSASVYDPSVLHCLADFLKLLFLLCPEGLLRCPVASTRVQWHPVSLHVQWDSAVCCTMVKYAVGPFQRTVCSWSYQWGCSLFIRFLR